MSSLFLEKAEWTKEPEGAEPAYVVFSGKLPSGEVFRHRAVALPVFLGRRHDPKDASLAPNYCFLGEGKPSKSISRKHATLSYNGKKQQYEMTCNGKNGFHIGRTEVQKDTVVEVKNGAAIRMGGARFYVLFPKEGTEVQETSGGKAASASVTAAAAASTKVKGNAKANAEGIKNEKKAKSAKGKGAHKDAGAKTSKAGKRKRNDKEVADGGNPKTKKKPRGGMHKMRKWIITAISARLLRQGEPGFTKHFSTKVLLIEVEKALPAQAIGSDGKRISENRSRKEAVRKALLGDFTEAGLVTSFINPERKCEKLFSATTKLRDALMAGKTVAEIFEGK